MDIAPIRENHIEKTLTKYMVTESGGLLGCRGLDNYQCHRGRSEVRLCACP